MLIKTREDFVGFAERCHRENRERIFTVASLFGRCTNELCGAQFIFCLDPSDPDLRHKESCCDKCEHLVQG